MANFCSTCGVKLQRQDAIFCSDCGAKIISPESNFGSEETNQEEPEDTARESPFKICVRCKGIGYINQNIQLPCAACGGSGHVSKLSSPSFSMGKFPPKPSQMTMTSCSICGGRGTSPRVKRMPCPSCGGKGKMCAEKLDGHFQEPASDIHDLKGDRNGQEVMKHR